jgi:hypothetical protein
LLATDLVLVPAQPSPFDGWASGEALKLIAEARIFRPELVARFVLNRYAARPLIARATAELLVDHDPPALASRIGQRVGFADAARGGRLVGEVDENGPAAREIAVLARGSRYERVRSQARLRRPPERRRSWVRSSESSPSRDAEPSLYTARVTIDVTFGQRGRSRSPPFSAD